MQVSKMTDLGIMTFLGWRLSKAKMKCPCIKEVCKKNIDEILYRKVQSNKHINKLKREAEEGRWC